MWYVNAVNKILITSFIDIYKNVWILMKNISFAKTVQFGFYVTSQEQPFTEVL